MEVFIGEEEEVFVHVAVGGDEGVADEASVAFARFDTCSKPAMSISKKYESKRGKVQGE